MICRRNIFIMHKITKLKNGLNFISVPVESTKAVTLMALFPVGSRYEDKKFSGISHFVEHMMFKGTATRPTYLEISRDLDAVGAEYNAFTGKDYTGYYIKINSTKQKLAFELLADMVFNSKFDKDEVKKEKGVIVEELRMYDDNPSMAIDNVFENLMFGDCPLGRDIGGTSKTVRKVTRQELFDYYKKYYRPDNMVLVAAGNIDEKNLNKNLKYFVDNDKNINSLTAVKRFQKFSYSNQKLTLAKRISVKTKKIDQANVIIGFPGIKQNHPHKYILSVLLSVLSGGMSSRLFVEVREKRGLAYRVNAGASAYKETGIVDISAGLDPSRLGEAVKVIKQELKKISSVEIENEELENAKNYIIGHTALSLENSSAQADWFAKAFLFNKDLKTYNQVVEELKKVTAKQIKQLASKIFDEKQMRLAIISPLTKVQVLKSIK